MGQYHDGGNTGQFCRCQKLCPIGEETLGNRTEYIQ